MPQVKFPWNKAKPEQGGARQDYIPPGEYKAKIIKYDPKRSQNNKEMHSFTFEITAGPEKGKKVIDRFVMPTGPKDQMFGLQRMGGMVLAAGGKVRNDGPTTLDPKKLENRSLTIIIADEKQEARKVGDRTFPARTQSRVTGYPLPGKPARPAGDDDDDEEDDDYEDDEDEEDEDLEDEDEDEDDEEDADDDEDDDDDDDEEEEAPAPRRRATAKAAAKPAKKAAAKPAAKKAKRKPADDDDDDDDDDLFDD